MSKSPNFSFPIPHFRNLPLPSPLGTLHPTLAIRLGFAILDQCPIILLSSRDWTSLSLPMRIFRKKISAGGCCFVMSTICSFSFLFNPVVKSIIDYQKYYSRLRLLLVSQTFGLYSSTIALYLPRSFSAHSSTIPGALFFTILFRKAFWYWLLISDKYSDHKRHSSFLSQKGEQTNMKD